MHSKLIRVNSSNSIAKYKQIIQSVIESVKEGSLLLNDKLPSVNEIAGEFNLSRDTVLLAYNELKKLGIIRSVTGKGYYVDSTRIDLKLRVLLLFDEFNSFKEDLYNSFIHHLGENAEVDIFFHHFNEELFNSILNDRKKEYTTYALMPAKLVNIKESISSIPVGNVFILDQLPNWLKGKFPAVYQSFDEDIYNGLKQGLELIIKYSRLVLVYPGGKEPSGFVTGFERFCNDFDFEYSIVPSLVVDDVVTGNVYVLPNDRDLVNLIKHCRHKSYRLGIDIGVISLNDSGLKEVVADGITTISTDFNAMGEILATMILDNLTTEIKNPSKIIIRNSL